MNGKRNLCPRKAVVTQETEFVQVKHFLAGSGLPLGATIIPE